MPRHELMRVSRYSAREMFDMVADVGAYQQFLPLVTQSAVYDHRKEADSVVKFKGRLQVTKHNLNISETFISDVVTNANALTIVSTASNGPVKNLTNIWQFVDVATGGSQSKLVLEYEIASFPMRMLMKASSGIVMDKLTEAFEKRAKLLYG